MSNELHCPDIQMDVPMRLDNPAIKLSSNHPPPSETSITNTLRFM
jgi:hypothetical protein